MPSNQLTTNEIISICISTAAFLISLATLYYSFFFKKIALVGCLLAWNEKHIFQDKSDRNSLFTDVQFALSNTGNRELLIRNVEIDWEKPPKKALAPIISSKDIPCVLKPAQISLIKLDVPLVFMKQVENSNQKLLIKFQVITPDGKRYFLSKYFTPYTEDLEFDDPDWEPFTLDTWGIKSLFAVK